ncbi:hypothetical protein E2C01_040565 [Portunus trituberculatus]|uniref:Uncharacterized protein n=1 Tax=Portunus trituberculatus TaxID=210409 RepID=A0A5B7FMZ9_PORTR|nr:hypothetical protein [Portunus trituberculatus]
MNVKDEDMDEGENDDDEDKGEEEQNESNILPFLGLPHKSVATSLNPAGSHKIHEKRASISSNLFKRDGKAEKKNRNTGTKPP